MRLADVYDRLAHRAETRGHREPPPDNKPLIGLGASSTMTASERNS